LRKQASFHSLPSLPLYPPYVPAFATVYLCEERKREREREGGKEEKGRMQVRRTLQNTTPPKHIEAATGSGKEGAEGGEEGRGERVNALILRNV